MKILWFPKRWVMFRENPSRLFATSNRIRVYNFHEVIKTRPGVQSDIAGYTVPKPDPTRYDVVIFQKSIFDRVVARLLKRSGALVVWDVCDPADAHPGILSAVDLVVVPTARLAALLAPKAPHIPLEVVDDAHEADETRRKRHDAHPRLRVTWMGTVPSLQAHLLPIKPVFENIPWVDFEFTVGRIAPPWSGQKGCRNDVDFAMDWREAWRQPHSWQQFIFQSDVGVFPVSDDYKSAHKILNYMAYGIPVICSPVEAHRQVVVHGVNGYFAETTAEWKRCLEELRDPAVRNRVGQAAAETARAFTVETLADRYLEVLRRYRARKPAPSSRSLMQWPLREAAKFLMTSRASS